MITPGTKLPNHTFKSPSADGPRELTTADVFAGKKVVVFAVPGAFTPTCSMNHLPGFVENHDAILAKGVDDIVCLAVNDHHVMNAWAKASNALDKMIFLADGDAAFTKEIGLDIDLSAAGMGVRSQRYSMIVEDGVVTALNTGDAPGKADISGAAAILEQL